MSHSPCFLCGDAVKIVCTMRYEIRQFLGEHLESDTYLVID